MMQSPDHLCVGQTENEALVPALQKNRCLSRNKYLLCPGTSKNYTFPGAKNTSGICWLILWAKYKYLQMSGEFVARESSVHGALVIYF